MCGRYVFVERDDFDTWYHIEEKHPAIEPHYNASPGEKLPVITRNSPNKLEFMRWGLVPFWAKDPRIGFSMINARADGIENKPAFRKPLRQQRCLIPLKGFYEWKRIDKEKYPYFIHLKDREFFSLAGLYDIWKDAEGKEIRSFTIITTEPNSLMEKIHNRMPVILNADDEEKWLDPTNTDVTSLLSFLKPYDAAGMDAYLVSRRVNKATEEGEDLIKPEQNQDLSLLDG